MEKTVQFFPRNDGHPSPAGANETLFTQSPEGPDRGLVRGAGNPGQFLAGQRDRVAKFAGEAKESLGETSFNRFVKHAPLVFELFKTPAKQSQCFLREPVLQILERKTTNVSLSSSEGSRILLTHE